MSRKKFFNFIMKFKKFRDEWIDIGLGTFGGLGFLYGVYALTFIFAQQGIKSPLLAYSMKAFGMWIGGAIIMLIIGMLLRAVYVNKKNWKKRKWTKK